MTVGDEVTGREQDIADLVAEITRAGETENAVALKSLLARAGEQLSFYEGFDRAIAENVRRSGELMLESLTLRNQMANEHGKVGAEERAALLDEVSALELNLESAREQIAKATSGLAALKAKLGVDSATQTTSSPLGQRVPGVDESELETVSEAADAAAPGKDVAAAPAEAPPDPAPERAHPATADPGNITGDAWPESRVIDVIAHDVSKAATALALQKHLRSLNQVDNVDAREFASGVLRLQVTARGPLRQGDVLVWPGSEGFTVSDLRDRVVELRYER